MYELLRLDLCRAADGSRGSPGAETPFCPSSREFVFGFLLGVQTVSEDPEKTSPEHLMRIFPPESIHRCSIEFLPPDITVPGGDSSAGMVIGRVDFRPADPWAASESAPSTEAMQGILDTLEQLIPHRTMPPTAQDPSSGGGAEECPSFDPARDGVFLDVDQAPLGGIAGLVAGITSPILEPINPVRPFFSLPSHTWHLPISQVFVVSDVCLLFVGIVISSSEE